MENSATELYYAANLSEQSRRGGPTMGLHVASEYGSRRSLRGDTWHCGALGTLRFITPRRTGLVLARDVRLLFRWPARLGATGWLLGHY